MNGDFMTTDLDMVKQNDAAYGSNRLNYVPVSPALCGQAINYATGKLTEACHKQVTYDVTQSYPENEVTAVLTSLQTELPQITGAPLTFEYIQYSEAVEFIRSNMNTVNVVNINAGIIKEMYKKYDHSGWAGTNGNWGVKNNPNTVTTVAPWTDYATLKTAIDAAISRLKSATDLTTESYSEVNLTYTDGVAAILSETNAENVSNREKIDKSYPGIVLTELPSNLEPLNNELFTVSYRPMLSFHHASIPSMYATEAGKYGLSDETLFTFESVAVQVEALGAVQLVTKAP